MDDRAMALLGSMRTSLASRDGENAFVPLVARGTASTAALAALGAEELSTVDSDRRAFLTLAARSVSSPTIEFYSNLARGETEALAALPAYLAACGWDGERVASYQPRPGCQCYSGYVAWLALNADPVETALAILANAVAFGGYCSTIAAALREHYGFDDAACAFFDLFGTPVPDLEALALASARDALDTGRGLDRALRYGRLLQEYELGFWSSLADIRA